MKRIVAALLVAVFFLSGCATQSIDNAESIAEALKIDEGYMLSPGEIYRTLGSENGLARVKMYADGTVDNFDTSNESYESCELSTTSGKILIFCLPYIGSGWQELKEGDEVRLYFNYQGYSEKLKIPSGVFMRAKYKDGSSVGGALKDDDTMSDFLLDAADEEPIASPSPEHAAATTVTPEPEPTPTPMPPADQSIEESAEPTQQNGEPGYVDAKSLNMRSGPSRNADIVEEIEGGTAVEITGEDGDWYAVTVNGKNGYMLKEYVSTGSAPEEKPSEPEEAPAPTSKPAVAEPPAATTTTTAPVATTTAKATTGQKNALSKAKDYLRLMGFSHKGLIEQLEYEGFSHDEAVYGADNCGADWNKQAARKAADYLEMMSFSRSGLIEQLEYEGFTRSQAEYGASQNGY